MSQDRLKLKIDGLDMDTVYASLVRQIAGDVLQTNNNESLKMSVERAEKIKQLEKQIATLKTKIHREKQLNRQMEMNGQLKKLKKELEEL
jgi:5'(3')-deoxyribonucleotidase